MCKGEVVTLYILRRGILKSLCCMYLLTYILAIKFSLFFSFFSCSSFLHIIHCGKGDERGIGEGKRVPLICF